MNGGADGVMNGGADVGTAPWLGYRRDSARRGAEGTGAPKGEAAPQPDVDWLFEVFMAMEQGILVWSGDGRCVTFNPRLLDVLELEPGAIRVGMTRREFLAAAVGRGEMSKQQAADAERRCAFNRPFSFDRRLPSGRVVVSSVRPVRGGGRVVTFTDVTAMRRSEDELAEAKRKADEAHRAAHMALLEQRARQREARLLAELDEWLQSCKSLGELFRILESFLGRVLPGSRGELYVYSNSRDALDGACAWGEANLHDHVAPDSCWALRRGRAYRHMPEKICFACDHVIAATPEAHPARYLCAPIIAHGDTVGLLHVVLDGLSPGGPIEQPEEFVLNCAEHVSLAIANVKLRDELRDQSTRDPLTGLYNRRYFLEAMRNALTRAARKGEPLALIAFDADKFKHFNDSHGHDAGDIVLRAVGQEMARGFGDDAVPCRFGGEEFALLLPGADRAAAGAAAEDLRRRIEGLELRYRGERLPPVTISAGVALYPECGSMPQDLIRAADTALYAAKEAGRNCWRWAGCCAAAPADGAASTAASAPSASTAAPDS